MSIPTDPGINLQDNVDEPILLGGETGLHERFTRLYDKFDGDVDEDNLSPAINALLDKIYIQDGARRPGQMVNVGFSYGGTGNGTLTICQANGSAFADTDGNRGYVWLRSATSGRIIRGKITSNVSIALVGAHWGAGTKGDLSSAILRVYAINDGNSSDDFTVKFGVGYQGGFTYIRNTQDSTTATDIDLPEEILVNSNVTNDNSPMSDIGYIMVNFDDTGNTNGEDFWTISAVYPGGSADGIWQPFNPNETGFSVRPSAYNFWTMIGKTVCFKYGHGAPGTSNSGVYTANMPIKSGLDGNNFTIIIGYNNGVLLTVPSYGTLVSGSTSLILLKDLSGAGWANANGKIGYMNGEYQAYQP